MIERVVLNGIAAALGDGWRVDDTQSCPRLYPPRSPDDRFIYFRSERGKLQVNGAPPRKGVPGGWYYKPKAGWPSIGVSIARGPEAIAREIKRRMLPAYFVAYEETQRALAEHLAYLDAGKTLAAQLAEILGVELHGSERTAIFASNPVYAQITASGDHARVEHMSLNREQAIAFAKFLAALPKNEDE